MTIPLFPPVFSSNIPGLIISLNSKHTILTNIGIIASGNINDSNKLKGAIKKRTSFSWVVLSSVVWVKVELSWGWAGVEIEMRLGLASIWPLQLRYLKSSIEVFEVFNWSIWSLVPLYYFPDWVVGWVAVLSENKAI